MTPKYPLPSNYVTSSRRALTVAVALQNHPLHARLVQTPVSRYIAKCVEELEGQRKC
jgi:hypothetical protein